MKNLRHNEHTRHILVEYVETFLKKNSKKNFVCVYSLTYTVVMKNIRNLQFDI